MSVGVTLQVQLLAVPNLDRLPLAGITGIGVALETAPDPVPDTPPVTQEGGQGVLSLELAAVPLKAVTKTSSAMRDVAQSVSSSARAVHLLADEGDEDLIIGVGGFIYSQIQAEVFFDLRMENYAITLAACARSGQLILLFGASHVHAHIFMRGFFRGSISMRQTHQS